MVAVNIAMPKDAATCLISHRFKKVPVVEGEKLVGVVNRGEIVRYFVREYLHKNSKATTDSCNGVAV